MTQKQNLRAFHRPPKKYTLHTASQQFHNARLNCCVTMLRVGGGLSLESGTGMCILKICEQLTFAFCRRPQPEICEVFVVDTISFKMEFIMQTALSVLSPDRGIRGDMWEVECSPLREIIHYALANKETTLLSRWQWTICLTCKWHKYPRKGFIYYILYT